MNEVYLKILELKTSYPFSFWICIAVSFLIVTITIWRLLKKKKEVIEDIKQPFTPLTKTIIKKVDNDKSKVGKTQPIKPKTDQLPKLEEKKAKDQIKLKPEKIVISEPLIILKKRQKEKLPDPKIETDEILNKNLYVDYDSFLRDNVESYPILRIPKKGCIVRTHRIGSKKRRGHKEKTFQMAIQQCYSSVFSISGNIRLNTGIETRPYEPDIAIIDLKSDKNIRIDIEIDEPYAGITRQATHCKGEDYARDSYFIDRGWIVIRFSEFQVHTFEKQCLKFIGTVIKSIDNNFTIPKELLLFPDIAYEEMWDLIQAQKWEKENYRENYLNHKFEEVEELPETIERGLNQQEKGEEKLVKPSIIGKVDKDKNIGYNKANSHQRDKRINFYPERHEYYIDNIPAPSASAIVSKFFPEFDAYSAAANLNQNHPLFGMELEEIVRIWKERGQKAANDGTFLHKQIEKYYLGEEYSETEEFTLFKKFNEENPTLNPYRSEWRIFDENYHIAGTIDLIAKNMTGFELYDWKRSKKVVNYLGEPITINPWHQGIGSLNHIDDTSYNRYCLQQSLYKYILETNYDLRINNMFLVVLYSDNERYYKVEVPYLENETKQILNAI